MEANISLNQNTSVQVVRKAVTCSKCSEPRTQDSRCENCGSEIPYIQERDKNEISRAT